MKRILFSLSLLLITPFSHAAGFDCNKAKLASEQAICAMPSLSSLDEILVLSFNKALVLSKDAKALKAAQQTWLATRNACQTDAACLTDNYLKRIDELLGLIAARPQKQSTQSADSTKLSKNTAPKVAPSPSGTTLTGTIASYECGDNCYLTVRDTQDKDHVALCTAPLCDSWNETGTLPADYQNKKVTVSLGKDKQYDAAGNVMGEMDAFIAITVTE